MTEYNCTKCNTLIEICCSSTGKELNDTSPGDKFICENCILRGYIRERTIYMATGREFKMIPELQKLIAESYTFKSLRNYSGKW